MKKVDNKTFVCIECNSKQEIALAPDKPAPVEINTDGTRKTA
jgi:hypothetical protein